MQGRKARRKRRKEKSEERNAKRDRRTDKSQKEPGKDTRKVARGSERQRHLGAQVVLLFSDFARQSRAKWRHNHKRAHQKHTQTAGHAHNSSLFSPVRLFFTSFLPKSKKHRLLHSSLTRPGVAFAVCGLTENTNS